MAEPEGPAEDRAGPETTTPATTGAKAEGQSTTPDQTTASGPETGAESFFDPESIKGKPELEAAYKQMQSAWTKRMQEAAKGKDKIRQYDDFMKNPVEQMKTLAQQLGYSLVQGQPEGKDGKPKTYNSWDEVQKDFLDKARKEFEPLVGELRNLKKQSIESQLDSNFPDWRTYEDEMMANLQEHPSLVSDPAKLYRLSVPPEVLEAKATQKALQRLKEGKGNQVQGQSTTTKQTSQTPKVSSFEDAVNVARQRLAQQGIAAPREH